MTQVRPQAVQITCPNCNNPFQTQIHTIVDVTRQPELKQALLSGQLNVAACPNCNMATMLGTPLIYHDADNKLCLVYIPQELNLSSEQEEQLIGEATGVLMQSLPPDTPRGHLLSPRRVMSLPSLIDSILEADGVPREVLEKQRQRVELISQLASVLPDEQQFASLVEQNRDEFTPDFFATIDAFIEASAQEGQEESKQVLSLLRSKLVEVAGVSADTPQPAGVSTGEQNEVIDRLTQVADDELEEAVVEARPSIDYSFFEAMTDRIDSLKASGKTAEAEHLSDRRARILDIVEHYDKEAQEIFEKATLLMREIMQEDDLEAALRARSDQLDDAFMLVLSANLASARRAGQADVAAQLEQMSSMAVDIIQEKLPPDDRLINNLMMAPTPEETSALLRSNANLVTADFVKKLNQLADEQAQQGAQDHANKLRGLAREAGAMLF